MKTKLPKVEGRGSIAKKVLTQLACVILIAICGIIIFFNVTHEYHTVCGSSMTPTLNNESSTDGVFVNRIKHYTRGDIIVARSGEVDTQTGEEKIIIKRLIAIGGDKLAIREIDGYNRIVIIYNDSDEEKVLEEPYLSGYSVNFDLKERFYNMVKERDLSLDSQGFITIAGDDLFFLGDNRRVSKDCSIYGPKSKKNVIGSVDFIAYGNTHIYWQVIKQVFGGK